MVSADLAERRGTWLHRAAGEQGRSGCVAAGEARFAIRFNPVDVALRLFQLPARETA
jgi:hypothetical protein